MLAPLLAALTIAAPGLACAQSAPAADKPRIAVVEFAGVDVTAAQAAAVTDEIRNALLQTGRFEVVERSKIETVLNEQALQQAAGSTVDAVKVGKLVNAQYIVKGRLARPGPNSYYLSVEAIDVETGQIRFGETARHEGPFSGLLAKLPALTSRGVARLFGEPPKEEVAHQAGSTAPSSPPAGAPEQPLTLRVFAAPLTSLSLHLVGTGSISEDIDANAISVGYERFFSRAIAGSATMHLGRVTGDNDGSGASGTFNMATLVLTYNMFREGWVYSLGGGVYFAALDYRMHDALFSGGQETQWTVSASGLLFRFGADYGFANRWFVGMTYDGDLVSNWSGSRIDAFGRNGGLNTEQSRLAALSFRVGYNL